MLYSRRTCGLVSRIPFSVIVGLIAYLKHAASEYEKHSTVCFYGLLDFKELYNWLLYIETAF